jgi:membrane protein implicated in regulation of membrane protease activity
MTLWSPAVPGALLLLALVAAPGPAPRADEAEGGPAGAEEGQPWTVQSVSGSVVYRVPGMPQAQQASTGDVIGTAAHLESGPDGQATLVRNGDQIRVHPNTHLQVAPAGGSGLGTLIRQTLGKLLFDVETIPDRSFRVETPALMAGVTGTRFTVEVTQDETALTVHEGAVWMARADRQDERVYFRAGETTRVRLPVLRNGAVDGRSRQSSSSAGPGTWPDWRPTYRSSAGQTDMTVRNPLGHSKLTIAPEVFLAIVAVIALVVVLLPRIVAALTILGSAAAWTLPAQWVLTSLLVLAPAVLLWRWLKSIERKRDR